MPRPEFFFASFLRTFIFSSLFPHDLHLVFCWVLSNFSSIYHVFMRLFYISLLKFSFSLLRFLILSYFHVILCVISKVCRLKYPDSYFSIHSYLPDFVAFLFVVMLIMLLIAAVISFLFLFKAHFSSLWIVKSTQYSMLANLVLSFWRNRESLCHLSSVIPCGSLSVFLGQWVPLLSIFRIVQSILQGGMNMCSVFW